MRRALAILVLLAACGDDDGGGSPDAMTGDAPRIDGPPPTCDLPAPGTRCADSLRLEQCDGALVVAVDCGITDQFCGPDPADPTGAACIQNGQECGMLTFEGACAGDVLAYCSGELGLTVIDCAAQYADCVFESADVGYNCVNPCDAAGTSVEGSCEGTTAVRRCEWQESGGFAVVTETCAAGSHCDTVEESGWDGCIPDGDCPGVGPQGRCDADTLVICGAAGPVSTDCAATGEVCAFGGPALGYVCAPPGTVGARSVTGTLRYEDRPATTTGLGGPIPLPVRGGTIALVDDTSGDVLAVALTADDGSFMLRHDAALGVMVHLTAAASSGSPIRPVRVIRPDGRIHGFGGASFPVEDAAAVDLLVTDASGVSEAFNIFDQIVSGLDFVRAELAPAAITPIFAHWVRGTGDGTYWFDPGMFLLGETLDDDGYDDGVIVHELGHYVEDEYSRDDSPGGSHDGSPTDPRLAWSEGFATWFSGAVRGDPVYVNTNAAGGWSYDADMTLTAANPAAAMTQDISEDTVSEILWDVGDAPAVNDDPSTAGPGPVLRAAASWFRSAAFVNRGHAGIDLVDWLDGWFVAEDLSSCSALRAVVGSRMFPYDFAGPAGACPL